MLANKRQMLGLGLGLAGALAALPVLAQTAPAAGGGRRAAVPRRKTSTRILFQGPKDKYINGITSSPQGLWLVEQKETGGPNSAFKYKDGRPLEVPDDFHEDAWLVDDKGAILKALVTDCRNTSGLTYGDGDLWLGANNAGHNGVYRVNMLSKTVSRRQVPLGPADDGGGIHGLTWDNGKIWIASNRLRAIMRVDAASWAPEFLLPLPAEFARFHGCAYDPGNDFILVVTGNNSTSFATGTPGLVRLDAKTGNQVEVIDFLPGSCDPHGLAFHQGKLLSCDAGLHPGWPLWDSPTSGAIFEIDIA